jgi:hypothetical protein
MPNTNHWMVTCKVICIFLDFLGLLLCIVSSHFRGMCIIILDWEEIQWWQMHTIGEYKNELGVHHHSFLFAKVCASHKYNRTKSHSKKSTSNNHTKTQNSNHYLNVFHMNPIKLYSWKNHYKKESVNHERKDKSPIQIVKSQISKTRGW